MDNLNPNLIRVHKKSLNVLLSESDQISIYFGAKLQLVPNTGGASGAPDNQCDASQYAIFQVISGENPDVANLVERIQHYVDTLTLNEAEDSSYDSEDCDEHQQVSRTTSDTLGQEFAEYVSSGGTQIHQDRSPGYTQRVEFALKLGYTERLVQAALARLGPNPAQNELLAELIKLGAQQGTKGDFALDLHNDGGSLFSPTHDSSSSLTTDDSPSTPLSTLSTLSNQSSTGAGGTTLRPVVIDGSNVAMSHGNKEVFSCRGLRLCVDWFKNRGHKEITVFVPKWRKESSRPDNPIKDQEILNELEKERMLVFTPSRLVGGKRMVCYDDRYILKLAADNDGIVVSNDNYRDLVQESSEFKRVVEERILMFSFVNDRFMPPDDPLGRSGPTLDNFLRIQPRKGDPPPPCPYGKKCTYGNKCKFHHPERGSMPHKSVTERLTEYAQKQIQARSSCEGGGAAGRPLVQGKSLSVPLSNNSGDTSPVGGGGGGSGVGEMRRKTLCRARSSVPDSQHLAGPGAGSLAQMEQMHLNHPYLQQTPSGWGELAQQQQQFPKSHSIENISPRDYSAAQIWQTQQQQQPGDPDGSINLHRKLQRQLTLNPAGCDPRIYQLQRSGMHQPQPSGPPQLSPHRPLQPSLSGPRTHHPATASQWDMHQNVTRIASAPDPSRPWHNGPPPASSSEPHINLWPTPPPQQQRSPQQHAQQPQTFQPTPITNQQDQRRRLHYHLASIFPEDQVQAVMQLYPDETNPQTICAAILSMFPKM